ncbi:EamA family transporter, partial [Rothia kristinae]
MELAERIPKKHRGTAALIAVLIGSTGIQVTTAVATGLFERFSPPTVSGLRLLTAAVILLAVARPRFWRFTRRDWTAVLSYGVVASLMNVFFYLAVQRIPLGVAVTIEYLGAFTVAILGVRRLQDGIFALGALAGVAMIAGPTFGSTDWWGYLFAALAAAAMCGYTLLSARIGSGAPASSGIRGLAVSITIGALLWLPATATAIPRMTGQDWLLAAFIGAFGLALAFSCDAFAASATGPAVVGVF